VRSQPLTNRYLGSRARRMARAPPETVAALPRGYFSPVGPERRSPRRASDGRNGALMWPERSDVKEVAVIKAGLGPHMDYT
jgi:hypothetical protein